MTNNHGDRKSPRPGVIPLPNGRTSWLINGGDPNHLRPSWDDPPSDPQNHESSSCLSSQVQVLESNSLATSSLTRFPGPSPQMVANSKGNGEFLPLFQGNYIRLVRTYGGAIPKISSILQLKQV